VGGDVADHLSDVSKKNNDAVIFVVNHSGGKDSMRMLHRLREEYSDVKTICVTADTGFETPEADSGGRMVKMRCASLANPVPVVVVRKCQEDLSRDGRASRKVSVSAVPAVHFRPEARSDLSGSSAHSRTRLSLYYCLPILRRRSSRCWNGTGKRERHCIRFMFRSFMATAQPEGICGDFRAGCASSRVTKMWRRWRNTTRKHLLWCRTWSGRSASP